MSKKAIVVGGAGFIGSNLVDALIDKGFDVEVIDNLVGGKKEQVNPKAKLHVEDILNLEKIKPIFKDAEYVFHLAALPRVQYSIEHPVETNRVNVEGTINVLIAAQEAGVKKLVYSASSSAYGDQLVMPLKEDMLALPKSPYGLQKYIGELYCRLWSEIYNLPTVCLRYFNVYGPRQNPDGAYALVIAKFLRQRQNNEAMTITGDGEQTRDFTHVRDIVRANILAAESDRVGKGEVINAGSSHNYSVNEIAAIIGGPTVNIPARLEPRASLADNTKAKELLGWVPQEQMVPAIAELKNLIGLE
jgi:nucleoside-diphosphate-sugar epimerase